MSFPLTQVFMDQYKVAAAEGALLELKLRLLADKTPPLQQSAGQRLQDIEAHVAKEFGASLTEADKSTLEVSRQLRNKILHCDFSVAREKLKMLGVASQDGGVRKINVTNLSGTQVAAKLTAARANVPGTFEAVATLDTKNHGNVYGWLLEMGNSGDFVHSAQVFKTAAAIVDRLIGINGGIS